MKSNCLTCGIEFYFSPSQKTGKYCSNKCQQKYQQKKVIDDWKKDSNTGVMSGFRLKSGIRGYLLEKYNHQCSSCGWNKVNPSTGKSPLEIDHIDGNPDNNTKENIRMLCPNCHSQTDTFGVKNKKSKHSQRNIYRRKNYRNNALNANPPENA